MADILSSPPQPKQEGGITLRDWRSVKVGELLSQKQLRFVDLETPVESACQVRNYSLNSVVQDRSDVSFSISTERWVLAVTMSGECREKMTSMYSTGLLP